MHTLPKTPAVSNLQVRPSSGYTRVSNELIDDHLAALSRVELGVYLLLARHASPRPTLEAIAARVRCSPRSVVRAIGRLKGLGLLPIVRPAGEWLVDAGEAIREWERETGRIVLEVGNA